MNAPTDPRLDAPTWDAAPPPAAAMRRSRLVACAATVALVAVLRVADPAGPSRQPCALRRAGDGGAVQRGAGDRVLVDVSRGTAIGRRHAAPPRDRRSHRRCVHPDLQRAGRRGRGDGGSGDPAAWRDGAGGVARRRQPGRDGGARPAPSGGLRPAHRAQRCQGRQHQPRTGAHARRLRRRPRLRPRARSAIPRAHAAGVRRPLGRVRADAAVLRQPRRRAARRRRVEPAGAVLRADRPGQGRPRRDVLLRHERGVQS